MKRMYYLFVVALITLASTMNAQPVEVTNSGFETGIVDGWGFDIGGGAEGSFEEEVTDVQEGAIALKAYVDVLGADPWSMQFKNETWAVESNKAYILSIWAKDISEGDANVVMNFTCGMTNAVDTWNEGTRIGDAVLAKEWQEYKIYFTPAAADIEAGLFAYMSLHLVGLGVAIFDNFTVTEAQTIGVSASGNQAVVEFIQLLADPAGNEANFAVKVNGVANVVTAIALDATNKKKVVLTLTDAVAEGAEVEVTYTPGTLVTTTGSEILEFTLSSTGEGGTSIISNNVKHQVSLYPNPAKNIVSFNVEDVRSIDILNVAGKLIKSIKTETNSLSVKDLNNGVYFLVIKNSKGQVFTNKLVVE